jgi:hypothetical protein
MEIVTTVCPNPAVSDEVLLIANYGSVGTLPKVSTETMSFLHNTHRLLQSNWIARENASVGVFRARIQDVCSQRPYDLMFRLLSVVSTLAFYRRRCHPDHHVELYLSPVAFL